jgi:hypothetical protein
VTRDAARRARENMYSSDARRGLLLTVVFFEKLQSSARQSPTRVREANRIDAWTLKLKPRVAHRAY